MSNLPALGHLPAGAVRYLYLPGDLWSHPQCPAPGTFAGGSPSWTMSGNVCVQAQVAPDSWTSSTTQVLLAQWVSGNCVFRLELSSTGSLTFRSSADGSTTSVAHAIGYSTLGSPANASALTIRVVRQSNNAGNTTTSFWVSTNYDPVAKTGTWTQKGSTQSTGGATAFFAGSKAPIQMGSCNDGTNTVGNNVPAAGKFYWANIYDGTDDTGTLIAMLDNRTPWAGYQGTNGTYLDTPGNQWTLKGPRAKWDYADVINQVNSVQTTVPLTSKSGWGSLAYMPFMPSTTSSALASGTWKFMPFTLTQATTLLALAVNTTVAASGGTAAMQFAIFNNDGSSYPVGTLNADLSGSGTIDLTTAAGIHSLTLSSGLALPAGNYWIGVMWQGTATTNPTLTVCNGGHPQVVGTSAFALNVNCYTQATTSVPNPAAPTATSTGLAVGYKQ